MVALPSLKVFTSIFKVTKENNKFELYTDTFDEFSFAEMKNEFKENFDISKLSLT